MKDRIALTLTLAALFSPAALFAQDTPPNALLALSKKGHTLAIVDPATLKVLAQSARWQRPPRGHRLV